MLRTIPLSPISVPDPAPTWQEQLADLVTGLPELLAALKLDVAQLHAAGLDVSEAALQQFPLRVPRPYLARMAPGDPHDPLLLQVLPQATELLATPGYVLDPLGEAPANKHRGLLHKYEGRVLLIATQSCAIHCRYCFRRHFPYAENRPGRAQWQESFDYISADASISEVILSGGDPLASSNTYLQWLVDNLLAIPHVQRLRIHTRLPIMLPARVDSALLQMLGKRRQQVVMVLHANHAQEFDADVDAACARLRAEGVHLLNQSVLLKGINDRADALAALSERLLAAGVLPYYVHMPDKVQGTAHFDVSDGDAHALMQALHARLPGYLVPRLVREESGKPGKTLLTPVTSG
ncbi:MAG TPA: EF-P beta-lysylation protein EpmB [Pseudomonadales bacterium]